MYGEYSVNFGRQNPVSGLLRACRPSKQRSDKSEYIKEPRLRRERRSASALDETQFPTRSLCHSYLSFSLYFVIRRYKAGGLTGSLFINAIGKRLARFASYGSFLATHVLGISPSKSYRMIV